MLRIKFRTKKLVGAHVYPLPLLAVELGGSLRFQYIIIFQTCKSFDTLSFTQVRGDAVYFGRNMLIKNHCNFFNVNTFLKSVSTSKRQVTYDLDIDLDTTTHKIIGVVGNPLYLAMPVSIYPPSEISSFTVVENVFTLTVHVLTDSRVFLYKNNRFLINYLVIFA